MPTRIKAISTTEAPAAIGPYNQAILAGNTLYCSGQIGIDPKTGELVSSSIQEETHQVFKNIQGVLKAADMDFSNVVKASVFMSDMDLYSDINTVYSAYFTKGALPAREAVAVKTLPKNVRVEISVIAVK